MHKYRIIIYWSEEDGIFIAEVPELPGCMTHGDTQAAALNNANKAIQGWIDTAKEFGGAVPEPKERRGVYNSSQSSSKRRFQSEQLQRRKNNPRIILNIDRSRARMNPKAH